MRRVMTNISTAKMQLASARGAAGGTCGVGFDGLIKPGGRFDSAVESVAVQVPGAVLVPAVAAQAAGVPSACVPFMN